MGRNKKNMAGTTDGNLTTLKIGSRVRCTDDGITGRLVWANAVSVKIQWDDGEQVTWKRDALATKPLEILDADRADDQTPAPAATDAAAESAAANAAEQPAAPADTAAVELTATLEQARGESAIMPTTAEQPHEEPASTTAPAEPTATEVATHTEQPTLEPSAVPQPTVEQATPSSAAEAAPTTTKPKRQRQAPAEPKEKKVSALDAAAQVLAEEDRPMTCKELIAAMAAKGYWTSPGGQTPDATLYSALLRELATKSEKSRFRKVGRGQFAYHAAQ
jgi:hypothetical protein